MRFVYTHQPSQEPHIAAFATDPLRVAQAFADVHEMVSSLEASYAPRELSADDVKTLEETAARVALEKQGIKEFFEPDFGAMDFLLWIVLMPEIFDETKRILKSDKWAQQSAENYNASFALIADQLARERYGIKILGVIGNLIVDEEVN